MKVRSTMYYGDSTIADCTWELDDRARTAQQALAAISIEDHLRASLRIEHKIIKDEPVVDDESKKNDVNESEKEGEKKNHELQSQGESDVEAGRSLDQPVQDYEDRELDRVEDRSEIDQD